VEVRVVLALSTWPARSMIQTVGSDDCDRPGSHMKRAEWGLQAHNARNDQT